MSDEKPTVSIQTKEEPVDRNPTFCMAPWTYLDVQAEGMKLAEDRMAHELGIAEPNKWYYTVECPMTHSIFSVGEAPAPEDAPSVIASPIAARCPFCEEVHIYRATQIQRAQALWRH